MTEISVDQFIRKEEQEDCPTTAEQLAAIKTVLEDHSALIQPLANQIAQPILAAETRRKEGEPAGYINGRLWWTISRAIQQLTSQMDRIVELVVALSKVPDDTGFMAFMQDMNEHWNEFAMGFDHPHSTDPNKSAVRQAWINMNAFNAKLSTQGIDRLNYRLRAGHVFRIALEETPWEEYHIPEIEEELLDDPEDPETIDWRDRMLERRDIRILNYWAPAAAAWIQYDGQGIYNMHEAMIGDNYANYKPSNWSGAKGFSKARFQYWCERFVWVSRVTALEYDTRQRAARAAEQMKQIMAEK